MYHEPESFPQAGSAARGDRRDRPPDPNLLTVPRVQAPRKLETQHHSEGGHAEERAAGPGNPTLSPSKETAERQAQATRSPSAYFLRVRGGGGGSGIFA